MWIGWSVEGELGRGKDGKNTEEGRVDRVEWEGWMYWSVGWRRVEGLVEELAEWRVEGQVGGCSLAVRLS